MKRLVTSLNVCSRVQGLGYELKDPRFKYRREKAIFLFLLDLSDGLWNPPSILLKGYWDFIPEVKRPEREADHSPSSNAEVKNVWSYTPYFPCTHLCRGQGKRFASPWLDWRDLWQDTRCTYTVIWRLVRVTIGAMEVLGLRICSFSYPACKTHATWLSFLASPTLPNFSTLSLKRHDFQRNSYRT